MSKLLNKLFNINESSNGSMKLVEKYFDDVENLMPDGEDDGILSSDAFDKRSIDEFESILKNISGGKALKFNDSKNTTDDGTYDGPSFGTDFTIKGKGGNYITGCYKDGAIAWGVGDPSQSAVLNYYGK